jgi:hypothetical protein
MDGPPSTTGILINRIVAHVLFHSFRMESSLKSVILVLSNWYHPTYTCLTSSKPSKITLQHYSSGHFELKTLQSPTVVRLLLAVPWTEHTSVFYDASDNLESRESRFCAPQISPLDPWGSSSCIQYKARSSAWYSQHRFLKHIFKLQTSLPRNNRGKLAHCYTLIIDGEIFSSRTPKSNSWRSWAHWSEDSVRNFLVHVRKRQAKREPSLVVGKGHISWMMVSLLTLAKQKQLARSSTQC